MKRKQSFQRKTAEIITDEEVFSYFKEKAKNNEMSTYFDVQTDQFVVLFSIHLLNGLE
ncbi:MAG: hypothetical protein OXC92_05660 [Flavobacteriaceae bacterium]|nr:hypothetical protein [Flavobacteriaceae bacterium]MCY4216452.1 hypothetical protein [Flavobacteriaceae bacterium]MCY4253822.1 hypothetical protein [Flavobacteriaceae bacterium]